MVCLACSYRVSGRVGELYAEPQRCVFRATNASPQRQGRSTIRGPRDVEIAAVVAVSSHVVIEGCPVSIVSRGSCNGGQGSKRKR